MNRGDQRAQGVDHGEALIFAVEDRPIDLFDWHNANILEVANPPGL